MMKRNHTGKVTELTRLPMNKNEILQLVKEHFQEGGVRDDGSCAEYYGDPDAFVKFALQVADIEYDRGFDDGWEGRANAERMLALSKLTPEELAQDPTNPPVDAL